MYENIRVPPGVDTSCVDPDGGLGVWTYKMATMAPDNVRQIALELDGRQRSSFKRIRTTKRNLV